MTTPKSKRRFLQFHLRTLFVLMTVFCIWFGWAMQKAREQKEAVAWVREMGGSVAYEYESDPFTKSDPPGPGWLRDILGKDVFAGVEEVRLSGSKVTDLTPLAKLKNLQWLSLNSTPVNDLSPLAELKNLQRLYLQGTQVSDLTPLEGLHKLYKLWLLGTPVSKEQVDALQKALPNCQIIWTSPEE